MRSYWRRIAECGRDVQLFLVYALISYLGIGVFSLMFNLYLVELGYDEGFIGAFNAVYTLTMGLTCLGIGYLINRFGNWLCIVVGTVEFTASMVAMCFATDRWLLLVLAAFNGIGSAFILTNQMPFVIEWTPKRHTATVAALSSALNSASIMLGSLLGGVLPGVIAIAANVQTEGITSYRWTLVTGAALSGLSLLPMLAMGTVRRERHHEDFQVAHAQLPNHRVRRQARRDIIALTLLGLFLAFGVGAIEPFYNVLLEDMGTSTSSIGLIFAVSGLVTTFISLGGPAVARRIGLVAAQVWIRLYHVPFHLALIFLPTPIVVSLAYATRKTSAGMAWPLESSHVGSLLPPAARAHAFGMRSASWNIGYAFAAFVSGQAIARTGSYTPAYVSLAVFCVLSVAVYAVAYGGRVASDEPADPKPATVSEVLSPAERQATGD